MFKLLLICFVVASALVTVYLVGRVAYRILKIKLDAYLSICWDYHVAEAFRGEHPDLVTDRDPKTLSQA